MARAAPVEDGHDVDRGRAGAAQVLVLEVEQVLVVGVGVDRRHQAGRDAEGVVEDLHHRHEAVRRARGVRDDHVVRGGVVGLLVDADDERGVDVGRRAPR